MRNLIVLLVLLVGTTMAHAQSGCNTGIGGLSPSAPLVSLCGGTGVNNGSSKITIGGNVTFTPAPYSFTGTLTGNTSVTFPTSGTLLSSTSSFVASVSNIDGTLTVSPTTGAVVASLNLANPNTWTGAQTFSQIVAGNAATHVTNTSASAAATDDLYLGNDTSVNQVLFRLNGGSNVGGNGANSLTLSNGGKIVLNSTSGGGFLEGSGTAGFSWDASGNPSFPGITGLTQCLHVSTLGAITGTGSDCGTSTGANPTATAGPAAVNGSASTFMRSDGAPAVQLGNSSQQGLIKIDGTTLNQSSNVTQLNLSNANTWNAPQAVSGSTNPTMAAGSVFLYGSEATAPTMSANGEGALYLGGTSGTTNGLTLQGKGSLYDVALQDSAGSVACGILTGTTTLSCSGAITGTSLSTTGAHTAFSGTAPPSGGNASDCYFFSSTSTFGVCFGTGVPTFSAAEGTLFLTTSGAPYYNNNGTTGWTQLGTGASPGGSNTQVQYNNSSAFGGISGFNSDGTNVTAGSSNFKIKGSSTGVTSIATANAGASNFTWTVPADSDTFAGLTATGQSLTGGAKGHRIQHRHSIERNNNDCLFEQSISMDGRHRSINDCRADRKHR